MAKGIECCGFKTLGKFCCMCGKRLRHDEPILALLAHLRKMAKSASSESDRAKSIIDQLKQNASYRGGVGGVSKTHLAKEQKSLDRLMERTDKWVSWRDAVEELIQDKVHPEEIPGADQTT